MEKPFKLGMIIGRFNHLHQGHTSMIDQALKQCEQVLVMIGSAQESGTIRNPFSVQTRTNLIRDVYPIIGNHTNVGIAWIDDMTNEDDHCVEWGDYVLDHVEKYREAFKIPHKLDAMFYGNDEERSGWYKPEAIKDVSQVVLDRKILPISATMMREYLAKGQIGEWTGSMPTNPHFTLDNSSKWFIDLREELLKIDYYKELAGGTQDAEKDS